MLDKIKGVVELSKKLDDLKEQMEANSEVVSKHTEELSRMKSLNSELKSEVSKVNSEASDAALSMQRRLEQMNKLNESLKEELYDFKLIKSQLKSRLISELTEDFRREMKESTSKLDADIKGYRQVKEDMAAMMDKLTILTGEIDKFKAIASQIRTADYDLAKYSKEVTKNDKEKLRLMRDIENLQRLISKERRRR